MEDLGTSDRTLRRWLAGEGGCPLRDFNDTHAFARARAQRLLALAGPAPEKPAISAEPRACLLAIHAAPHGHSKRPRV